VWFSITTPKGNSELFAMRSQMNGSHGEYTESDDTASNQSDRQWMMREAAHARHNQHFKNLGSKHGNGKGRVRNQLEGVVPAIITQGMKGAEGDKLDANLNAILNYRKSANAADHVADLAYLSETMKLNFAEQKALRDQKIQTDHLENAARRIASDLDKMHACTDASQEIELECRKNAVLIECLLDCDEDIILARKAKIAALVKFNRETFADRSAIADDEYRIADITKNGAPKSSTKIRDAPVFQKLQNLDEDVAIGGDEYPVLNIAAKDRQKLRSLNVPLITGPLFIESERITWGKWFGRGLLRPFYQEKVEGVFHREHREYNLEINAGVESLSNTKLLLFSDTTLHSDMLDHYRFLGFQSKWISTLFQDSSWLTVNKFDRYRIVTVHPHVYHAALTKGLGREISKNFLQQVTRDLSEYLDYLPADMYSSSVAAGIQAASMINYTSGVTAAGKSGVDSVNP
jgi:hypothetical protein